MRASRTAKWVLLPLSMACVLMASVTARGQTSEAAEARGGEARGSAALALVESQIRRVFPDVSHLPPEMAAGRSAGATDRVVLLDVREASEYAVSRIPGAIWIDPASRGAAHVAALAGGLDDAIVVAYCSIGLRSSRLLVRIGQGLKEKGARELHNLEGGIFRWRNEGRPLVGPDGVTRAVHRGICRVRIA